MAREPTPISASPPEDEDSPAKADPSPYAPRPARPSLLFIDGASTRLRNFIFNIAFVGLILLLVPVLGSQFFRSEVLIEPIAVPAQLVTRGLTPEVVSSRLWDGLRDAKTLAATTRVALNATPDDHIEFSVPKVGLSMDSVVQQTRQFFNIYETRISGEFVCATLECIPRDMRLRLRVVRATSEVIDLPPVGDKSLRDYFTQAAIQILAAVDPYIAAAAIFDAEPVRGMAMMRRLIRQQHPDAKWAHNFIGLSYWLADDYDNALTEYRAAIAIDPNFQLARVNAGNTLVKLGDPQAARALYDIVAAAQPDNVEVRIGYANLAEAEGRHDEAIAMIEAVADSQPGNPQYTYLLGDMLQTRGDTAAAEQYYKRSLQADPSYSPALTQLFELTIASGDLAGGEAILRAATDFRPDDPDIMSLHGLSLIFTNDAEGALKAFSGALVLQPDNVELMQQVATQLQNLDRQAEAVPILDRAIALDPYNAGLVMSRGTSLALSQQNAAARRDFERILDLEPAGSTQADMATNFLGILDDLDDIDRREAGKPALEPAP